MDARAQLKPDPAPLSRLEAMFLACLYTHTYTNVFEISPTDSPWHPSDTELFYTPIRDILRYKSKGGFGGVGCSQVPCSDHRARVRGPGERQILPQCSREKQRRSMSHLMEIYLYLG